MAQKQEKTEDLKVAEITMASLVKLIQDDNATIRLDGKKVVLKIDFEDRADLDLVEDWEKISDDANDRSQDCSDLDDDDGEGGGDFDEGTDGLDEDE